MFTIGHTSTSVSLALGLAIGRDLNKKAENIIAIIGDGSLSGGEALEAIDYAGEYNKNLIIIVNDNDQVLPKIMAVFIKRLKNYETLTEQVITIYLHHLVLIINT